MTDNNSTDLIRFSPGDIENYIHPTSNYLSFDIPLTRAGIFLYEDDRYPGGIRREYRPPEEVLDSVSLKTISGGGLPLIRLHPDVEVVTTQTFEGVDLIGNISDKVSYVAVDEEGAEEGSPKVTDGIVRGRITLYKQSAIDEFRSGEMKSLSLGYNCDRYFEPGQLENGAKYDSYQTNIKYNHGSSVPFGRYGIQSVDEHVRKFAGVSHDGLGFNPSVLNKKQYYILNPNNSMATTKKAEESTVSLDQLQGANTALTSQVSSLEKEVSDLKAEIASLKEAPAPEVDQEEVLSIVGDAVCLSRIATKLQVLEEGEDATTLAVPDGGNLLGRVIGKVAPNMSSEKPEVLMTSLRMMESTNALDAFVPKTEETSTTANDSAPESVVAVDAAKSKKSGEAKPRPNRYKAMWLASNKAAK